MLKFYQLVRDVNPNHRNISMTVTDGPFFAEKALLSNQEILYKSSGSKFFSQSHPKLEEIDKSGAYFIDGCHVFCEQLTREKKIVICGGGHVSIPLIQMSRMLGFQVQVLEDRPKFADHARRAGASLVLCEPFEQGLSRIPGDRNTFFVIVTRGHRYDQVCLTEIARKEHAYIGMIGSKKRAAAVKEAVIEAGCSPEVIRNVHSPIGLMIGAKTPEEIAVSILAELIQVKNQETQGSGYPREILEALLDPDAAKTPAVLATIVARKGSSPRETGAKMLIRPDGSCIGTIGGGCLEAGLLTEARRMLLSQKPLAKLCPIDMTGAQAEEEGMICGGRIEVLLELILP